MCKRLTCSERSPTEELITLMLLLLLIPESLSVLFQFPCKWVLRSWRIIIDLSIMKPSSSSNRSTCRLHTTMMTSWLLSLISYKLFAIIEFSKELLHCRICSTWNWLTISISWSFILLVWREETLAISRCCILISDPLVFRLYVVSSVLKGSLRLFISVRDRIWVSISYDCLNMIHNRLVCDSRVWIALIKRIYERAIDCLTVWVLLATSIESLSLSSWNSSLWYSHLKIFCATWTLIFIVADFIPDEWFVLAWILDQLLDWSTFSWWLLVFSFFH